MTAFTGHVYVSAGQWEIAEIVIEVSILPVGRVMAGSTICAKLTAMRVILMMTGIAILRRRCEIRQTACIDMALGTVKFRMLAGKLK